jgi:hypothetical protein
MSWCAMLGSAVWGVRARLLDCSMDVGVGYGGVVIRFVGAAGRAGQVWLMRSARCVWS